MNSNYAFLKSLRKLGGVAVLSIQLCTLSDSLAQQIASTSPVITYQGMLREHGSPITGEIPVIAILYSDPNGNNEVWRGQYTASVRDGYFNLELGSGKYPLPSSDKLDGELWLGVIAGESGKLLPLTRLSAAPFALSVADRSITKEKVDFQYVESITIPGQGVLPSGPINLMGKKGVELKYDAASRSLLVSLNDSVISSASGKGGRSQYIGITNSNDDGGTPIGSHPNNAITGGDNNLADDIAIGYNAIIGGEHNWAKGGHSTVGGGLHNKVQTTGRLAFIGGGYANQAVAVHSTIAGGWGNTVAGTESVVGGGWNNQTSDQYTSVLGGGKNAAGGFGATIGGGTHNTANGILSFIGGGGRTGTLTVGSEAPGNYSVIGGGSSNKARGHFSFIGGGGFDDPVNAAGTDGNITDADYAIVVGGRNNLANGFESIIVGGRDNVSSSIQGTIGGGNTNAIEVLADRSFIGAGTTNKIKDGGGSSVIGGGETNELKSFASVIGGGQTNTIGEDDAHSFIGGGAGNDIGVSTQSPFSVIAGGVGNETKGTINTIGGGSDNIATGISSTIAGGESLRANAHWSSIGGGKFNKTHGVMSNIPGGEGLEANVFASTVIGSYNVIKGITTWPPDPFDRKFIIGNGLSSIARSNAFEVSNNGHSIVYHTNGSGMGMTGQAAIRGGTYTDNVVYAWGSVQTGGVILRDFGVTSVVFTPPNVYTITLNNREPDPNTGAAALDLTGGSVTATIVDIEGRCGMITVSPITGNVFNVYTYSLGGTASPQCSTEPRSFNFKVTGRPQ